MTLLLTLARPYSDAVRGKLRGREPPVAARSDRGRGDSPLVHSAQQLVDTESKRQGSTAGAHEPSCMRRQRTDVLLRKPVMSPRRRLVRFQSPFATSPDHRVLAETKYP